MTDGNRTAAGKVTMLSWETCAQQTCNFWPTGIERLFVVRIPGGLTSQGSPRVDFIAVAVDATRAGGHVAYVLQVDARYEVAAAAEITAQLVTRGRDRKYGGGVVGGDYALPYPASPAGHPPSIELQNACISIAARSVRAFFDAAGL